MLDVPPPFHPDSPRLRPLLRSIERFAQSRLLFPVLLLGPSGSGKTFLARHLALRSGHPDRISEVNAAAIPGELAVSELFGHSQGAFTDAKGDRRGALERANGGVLFLDEISHLHLRAQALLLTVLETGRFNRLGDGRQTEVRVRLILATNRSLDELVRSGQMLPDFCNRINLFSVTMPALSERRDDILPMARHYLKHLSATDGKGRNYSLTREAESLLVNAPWPLHLRGLWGACHRATIDADSPVLSSDLFPAQLTHGAQSSADVLDFDLEVRRITEALTAARGNKSEAARRLGWSLSKLKNRLRRNREAASGA